MMGNGDVGAVRHRRAGVERHYRTGAGIDRHEGDRGRMWVYGQLSRYKRWVRMGVAVIIMTGSPVAPHLGPKFVKAGTNEHVQPGVVWLDDSTQQNLMMHCEMSFECCSAVDPKYLVHSIMRRVGPKRTPHRAIYDLKYIAQSHTFYTARLHRFHYE